MAAQSNETLNNQSHCTICLEGLAVRTNVTLRCRHTFHLDCLGSAFNAGNAMRCPVCRAMEDGVWRTFPTSGPLNQEDEQGPPVQLQPPSEIYPNLDQGWFGGSLSLGNGGPIRHPYSFRHSHRDTANMMIGSADGSGRASVSSGIIHLRLGVNRRPNHGYSFQGNVGPRGHHHQLRQVLNNVNVGPSGHHDQLRQVLNNLVELEAPDVVLGEAIFNNRASVERLLGRLAGAAPLEQQQAGIDGSEFIMSDDEDSAEDPPE